MAFRKTGTRNPSGALAESYKNRDSGPYKNQKTGTWDPSWTPQKLENRDPGPQ